MECCARRRRSKRGGVLADRLRSRLSRVPLGDRERADISSDLQRVTPKSSDRRRDDPYMLQCSKSGRLGLESLCGKTEQSMRTTVPAGTGKATSSSAYHSEVTTLAREFGLPVEQVARVYDEQARRIAANARITNFVPVIVNGRVRAELQRLRRAGQAR